MILKYFPNPGMSGSSVDLPGRGLTHELPDSARPGLFFAFVYVGPEIFFPL